jgi:hypothetical protein
VRNIVLGMQENKVFNSGFYTGKRVYCVNCNMMLGWNYIEADNKQVAYKEGKTSFHSLLLSRSQAPNAKTCKDLLDIEVPIE